MLHYFHQTMNPKLIANIVLSVVIVILGFWLFKIIQEPIIFQREKKVREDATVQRLKDIRTAQMAYRDAKGKFAKNFDDLVRTIKYDSIPVILAIGEAPDSLTEAEAALRGIITRDTTFERILTRTFSEKYPVDSLPYIPFTNKVKFNIDAGEITKNNVKIQVFEVGAAESMILEGLNEKFIDYNRNIKVGSMTEGTYTGNWE